MKKFNIPNYYRSSFITQIKEARKITDPRKKDFLPTLLDFGSVRFFIARHFGFCYGVENAVEIAYKALEENPNKRVFLLSEMIHNPTVNLDLQSKGIHYIMDNLGNQLVDWSDISDKDIVVTPAFGTTVAIENQLKAIGILPQTYNATCPFVEKVWKKSHKLGEKDYTVVVHGKPNHEETRATFSHAQEQAPTVIVQNMAQTLLLADVILGKVDKSLFYGLFENQYSAGFDVDKDLARIGVVNQTTMLASDTRAISETLKQAIIQKFGVSHYKDYFADTSDTLCYATEDNQSATIGLLDAVGDACDFAIVVGGYNSSNTAHLVELCEQKLPTFYISDAQAIESQRVISHFDYETKKHLKTNDFIPQKAVVNIVLTSGASCPDTMVDAVLDKLLGYFPDAKSKESVLKTVLETS